MTIKRSTSIPPSDEGKSDVLRTAARILAEQGTRPDGDASIVQQLLTEANRLAMRKKRGPDVPPAGDPKYYADPQPPAPSAETFEVVAGDGKLVAHTLDRRADGPKHPIAVGQASYETVCWREHNPGFVCIRPEGHLMDDEDSQPESVAEALFEIANKYRVPVTNNECRVLPDGTWLPHVADFISDICAVTGVADPNTVPPAAHISYDPAWVLPHA